MKATLNIHDLQKAIAITIKNFTELKGWRFVDSAAEDAIKAAEQAKSTSEAIDVIERSLDASRIRA